MISRCRGVDTKRRTTKQRNQKTANTKQRNNKTAKLQNSEKQNSDHNKTANFCEKRRIDHTQYEKFSLGQFAVFLEVKMQIRRFVISLFCY